MSNKILVFKNKKNNKNIDNKRGSVTWHKKPYFIYTHTSIFTWLCPG